MNASTGPKLSEAIIKLLAKGTVLTKVSRRGLGGPRLSIGARIDSRLIVAKLKFALLERVVDGKVVRVLPRVMRISEAKYYAKVAATQGQTYNVVPCEAPHNVEGKKPTRRKISYAKV